VSHDTRLRRHRVRVFSVGRDVADSTFAEDSDTSTPRQPRRNIKVKRATRRQRIVDESTTDALTDLERRVQAMRIWASLEEERKEWLMNEIKKKSVVGESVIDNGSASGSEGGRPSALRFGSTRST
jgi:hypothetical protein